MSPASPDEDGGLDMLAAEYVIGTLDGPERTEFGARLITDEGARRAVAAWEQRLAPLRHIGVAATPPSDLWPRIARALDDLGDRRPAGPAPAPAAAAVLRSRNRWRSFALAATGVAAALAVVAVLQNGALRSVPPADTVSIAAVTRNGDKPALIVSVDRLTRRILIRPVAARVPAGHSLQLWYIGAGHSPLSMGLVPQAIVATRMPEGAVEDPAATFAISVEPPGGSTTGGPTGAVLYSGQLVKE